ncbi:MAG: 4-alpha-glucanotransferase [Eubacterium sp.]
MQDVRLDCFSPDGQLWGNPVYDWKKLKKQKYSWWIERLNQSFKIYDIVRIDHAFRGPRIILQRKSRQVMRHAKGASCGARVAEKSFLTPALP